MDMWMSPTEQSAFYQPHGQAMENAKRLPQLDPHSQPSQPHVHRLKSKFFYSEKNIVHDVNTILRLDGQKGLFALH